MGSRRRSSLVVTTLAPFAVAVLVAAVARGEPVTFPECTREPSAADVEGAKGAHKAAEQFFERGDYARAIQYWRDAYSFDCTKPKLLINVANAYEKSGDKLATIATLETYLKRAPNAPDSKVLQEKVANLKASMKPAPAPSAPTTAEPAPPPSASAPPPPPPAETPSSEGQKSLAPWVVVGVGGAAVVAGAILLPVGLSTISDAEARCPTRVGCTEEAAADGNAGRVQSALGGVFLGVGAAAVAGGLIWEFAFNEPSKAESLKELRVVPQVHPRATGVTVEGRF